MNEEKLYLIGVLTPRENIPVVIHVMKGHTMSISPFIMNNFEIGEEPDILSGTFVEAVTRGSEKPIFINQFCGDLVKNGLDTIPKQSIIVRTPIANLPTHTVGEVPTIDTLEGQINCSRN